MDIETYIKILDEIKDIIPLIQVSGINTDPLTNPDIIEIIKAINERGFICGLHTKGYRMNSQLNEILTANNNNDESFITFSLNASNSKNYIKIHGIEKGRKDPKAGDKSGGD